MTNLAFAVAMALPALPNVHFKCLRAFQRTDAGISLHEDEIFLAMIVPSAASPGPRCSTGLTGIATAIRRSPC
jgi:hypothetical protein